MKRNLLTITAMMLVLILAISVVSVGAVAQASVPAEHAAYYETIALGEAKGVRYQTVIFDKLGYTDKAADYWEAMNYSEPYRYFSTSASDSVDESTPDYVLVRCGIGLWMDFQYGIVGPYLITDVLNGYFYGDSCDMGWYIYIPAEDVLYTIDEAYEAGIEGIDKAFENSTSRGFYLIGDTHRDFCLDVRDATYLQKVLAQLEGYGDSWWWQEELMADFNRDETVNIKDATAIQKHIAGLEYM